MNDRGASRAGWVVIGSVVGFLVGLWSPADPVLAGGLGALIAAVLTSPSSANVSTPQAIRAFLERAVLSGDLDDATYQRLLERLPERVAAAATPSQTTSTARRDVFAPPAPRMPTPPGRPTPPSRPASPSRPTPPSRPTSPSRPTPAAAAPPSPRRERRRRRSAEPGSFLDAAPFLRPVVAFWRSLRADFGVQGLGSLGVLLVFTATLGFVVFAFSEVGTSFRPLAELMVPIVLFGLSRFLRRRSAPFMASALEGLAGAVTPIMVFAAFMDGAPLPPDPERAGLVAALSASSLVLAAMYAWASIRRATSPLRYLVAPLVWLAVGVLGMGIDEEASAALFALVLAAIAITPWIPVRRPTSPLRRATDAMVVPGLILAYTCLLIFGFAEGWPAGPMLAGGLAALAALEGARSRVPRVWIAEAAVVAITCAAAAVDLGASWAGALAVGSAVVLAERWIVAGADRIDLAGFAAVATAGAMAAVAAPGPLLVVGLAFAVWSHTRRLITVAFLGVIPDVVGAVAPGVAVVALGWLTESWVGFVAGASVLLALATLVRTQRPGDAYLAYGTLVYAAALGAAGGAGVLADVMPETGSIALALTLSAFAVAIVPGRVDVRVWLSSGLVVAAWFVTGAAAAWSRPTVAVVLGAAGLAYVIASLRVPGRIGGHVAMVGHVIGAIALSLVVEDPARIAVLGAFLAGWLIEVAAQPVESPLQRLAGPGSSDEAAWIAPLPVLGGLPFLALAVVAETHPSAGIAGAVLVFAGTAVAYGLVAGLPVWRRALTQEAVVAGVMASVAALTLATGFDPLVASDRALQLTALASGIVGVVLCGRRAFPAMHWYAWALTMPAALLVGLAGGVPLAQLHWPVIGWGGAISIAALIGDKVIAGRQEPYLVRTWWLRAPLVVGVFGGVSGIASGLAASVAEMWPVAVAATLWSAVLAALLRGGAVTYVTWAAAALAYVSALVDGGYDPLRDPALLTWATMVLLALGLVLPNRSSFGRLDVPPLAVGLGLAAVAVGAGIAAGATAVTWAPIGGALLVVATVKPEWVALAPLGSLLTIGAAAIAGPWYLTAVLAAHSAGLAVLARMFDGSTGTAMQWMSALLGAGAWASLMDALNMTLSSTVSATATASVGIAGVAAVLVVVDPSPDRHARWSGPWVAVAFLGVGLATAAAVTEWVVPEARWTLVAALGAWSVATCVAATRLAIEELRLATLALLTAFVAIFGWAGDFTISAWSIWTLALATLATTVGAGVAGAIDRLGWRMWFVAAAGGLHFAGATFAALLLPDRDLLVLSLLALCGASIVADLVFGIRGARLTAPGFGFGAWVAFVTELGSADIQWYAPPFALAVIIDLELLRRQRRKAGDAPASTEEMVVAELVAMALAIGPSLVQVVFEHVAYGLLAIGWGAVATVWGTTTRVRRRVIAGGGGAALGALLMIVVPLAELLPEFRGPTLWIAVFAVGAVLIAVASTLEQTRRRIVELKTSFAEMTDGWE